jgi:hypothetical protein
MASPQVAMAGTECMALALRNMPHRMVGSQVSWHTVLLSSPVIGGVGGGRVIGNFGVSRLSHCTMLESVLNLHISQTIHKASRFVWPSSLKKRRMRREVSKLGR